MKDAGESIEPDNDLESQKYNSMSEEIIIRSEYLMIQKMHMNKIIELANKLPELFESKEGIVPALKDIELYIERIKDWRGAL